MLVKRMVVVNRYGKVIYDEETEYKYEVGDFITLNSSSSCKCKEVIRDKSETKYLFVQGWTIYGF